MELVVKLRFLNEYGELETFRPVDRAEASGRVAEVESGAEVVLIVSLLVISFMYIV